MAWVNVRGVRESALVVNLLTVGKLLPLAIFIVVGAFYVHPPDLTTLPHVTISQGATAALLLVYVYGGYEVVPVIAGEALDPRKHIPFAMVSTILIVMTVTTLTQVVAQGILTNVAGHGTPIADAAAVFLGSGGALLISAGSVVAITGNNTGQVLSGSRMLFALGENGDLPAFFARVHSRYRTPVNAILFTSAVALALALTGSFAQIAVVSAVARIVMYIRQRRDSSPALTGVSGPREPCDVHDAVWRFRSSRLRLDWRSLGGQRAPSSLAAFRRSPLARRARRNAMTPSRCPMRVSG